MRLDRLRVAGSLLSLLLCGPALANAAKWPDGPFVLNGLSIEGRVGPYWSPTGIGPSPPSFDYVRMAARLGWC